MRNKPNQIEIVAAAQVGGMLIFSTWAFGSGVGWARDALAVFGSLAPLVTLPALRERLLSTHASLRAFWWLLPLAIFDLIVLASLAQPLLRLVMVEASAAFVPITNVSFLPGSAQPHFSKSELWLLNALYLPCFNLMLAVRHRRTLRVLLLIFVGNALALSVFGTLQKLTHAEGMFFGSVCSPNKTFFASFIYHNHWGAFAVLALAAGTALVFHRGGSSDARNFFHSPAFGGIVAIFFLAATIPLSGSRSCTALAVLIILTALAHIAVRIRRTHRGNRRAFASFLLAGTFVFAVAMASIYTLAESAIEERIADTRDQLGRMRAQGSIGARAQLYCDTWRMAQDRPLFGWGLGSYGTVFQIYNTQESTDRLPQYYEDAHSDWLELIAETGFVGFACMSLLVGLPLWSLRQNRPLHSLSLHLLLGCALILVYAWIEFPFGNPAVTLSFWFCLFTGIRMAQFEEPSSHDH